MYIHSNSYVIFREDRTIITATDKRHQKDVPPSVPMWE